MSEAFLSGGGGLLSKKDRTLYIKLWGDGDARRFLKMYCEDMQLYHVRTTVSTVYEVSMNPASPTTYTYQNTVSSGAISIYEDDQARAAPVLVATFGGRMAGAWGWHFVNDKGKFVNENLTPSGAYPNYEPVEYYAFKF